MSELNCSDLESTLASTAEVLDLSRQQLEASLQAEQLEFRDPPPRLESVVWFHATRIPRDADLRDGLLPAPAMRPKLLDLLRRLALDKNLCTASEWPNLVSALSSDALSWKHSLPSFDDGPHGFLVREVIIDRGRIPITDYTAVPEYIRCLCSGFEAGMGEQLLDLYRRSTAPAIVPFRSRGHLVGVIKCALHYAQAKLQGRPLDSSCNQGFSNKGAPIPFPDILSIEWLEG